MCPVVMVVADIFTHQSFQMPLIKDDHMIQQITAAVANKAFRDFVLPRATEAGSLRCDAEAPNDADDFLIELRSSVEDQVL